MLNSRTPTSVSRPDDVFPATNMRLTWDETHDKTWKIVRLI